MGKVDTLSSSPLTFSPETKSPGPPLPAAGLPDRSKTSSDLPALGHVWLLVTCGPQHRA